MKVGELIEILSNADDDYVVSISTEKEISAYKKDGTKRTGGAIFIDGGILLCEKADI